MRRREPEIAFACPECRQEATAGLTGAGRCPSGHDPVLALSPEMAATRIVERCPPCGGTLLYVQRDFNQKAGLAIVVAGAVLAPFTPYYASLVAAALIDALLYWLLPEITVCYRCQAHFRRFRRNPRHRAFDLHVAEQYHVHPPPP